MAKYYKNQKIEKLEICPICGGDLYYDFSDFDVSNENEIVDFLVECKNCGSIGNAYYKWVGVKIKGK